MLCITIVNVRRSGFIRVKIQNTDFKFQSTPKEGMFIQYHLNLFVWNLGYRDLSVFEIWSLDFDILKLLLKQGKRDYSSLIPA